MRESLSTMTRGVATALRQAWQRDVFHYSFSLAAVQGGAYIAQFFVARFLGPADFGYVRVMDTVLALLLVPAGFGLASAIVRWTAMSGDADEQGSLLSFMLIAVVTTSALGAAITLVVLPRTSVNATAQSYLSWLVWLVVFTNAGRLIINYFQGKKEIRRVAFLNVAFATVGIALVVVGAWRWGVSGWAVGRFLGDTILAVGLFWIVRGALRAPVGWHIGKDVMAFGLSVVASGALDRVATQADTLYLDAFVGDPRIIGQYGAASLLINVAGLVPTAALAVALPHLSERAHEPVAAYALAKKILVRLVAGAVVLAVVVGVAGPPAILVGLGHEYQLAGTLLPWLAVVLVLNVAMGFLGTFLLALGRAGLTVWQSALGVAVNIGANAWLMPRYGVQGAVWAQILTALARGLSLWFFVWWVMRAKPGAQEAPG